jgi:hypothetical protein
MRQEILPALNPQHQLNQVEDVNLMLIVPVIQHVTLLLGSVPNVLMPIVAPWERFGLI